MYLSFMSSNSSFIKCIRNYNSSSNIISFQDAEQSIIASAHSHYFENIIGSTNNATHKTPGHTTLFSSASFTLCVWNKCSVPDSDKIYVSISIVELTIQHCKFLSYIESACHGSAIYVFSAGIVHVYSSCFSECTALSETHSDNGGGGI